MSKPRNLAPPVPAATELGTLTARRALGLLLVSGAGAWALHAARQALPLPPLSEPSRLGDWWLAEGTAIATLSIVRVAGLALCCYLALIALLGAAACLTRWRWTVALTRWMLTPALRRVIAGGGLAMALASSPAAASASTTAYSPGHASPAPAARFEIKDIGTIPTASYEIKDIGTAPAARFEIKDIGTIPTANYEIKDIGAISAANYEIKDIGTISATNYEIKDIGAAPATEEADSADASTSPHHPAHVNRPELEESSSPEREPAQPAARPSALSAAQTETWLVAEGDHLWGIAVETVAQRASAGHHADDHPDDHPDDHADDHMSVLRYWLKLIEANADVVGDDPDLIYPGQVIRLPG